MTDYEMLELAARLKIALLQAVTATELCDWPLYDSCMNRANELRARFGGELDSTG